MQKKNIAIILTLQIQKWLQRQLAYVSDATEAPFSSVINSHFSSLRSSTSTSPSSYATYAPKNERTMMKRNTKGK